MDLGSFSAQASTRLVPTIQGAVAFVPPPLPPTIDLAALFQCYGEAMSGLGALNAKLAQLKNPSLVIRPLQRREAILSSAMEGTFTTSDELALVEAGARASARADTLEVYNYGRALTHAVSLMDELPICHRLICETHALLLSNLPQGRGGNKRPGQYKHDQNWIGGATITTARFVPPPPDETQDAMNRLEAFINRPDTSDVPPLVEAALVHYQFETIHPFADGNGRVGRILIPLLLLARGVMREPVFYPSASMEERKNEYIDRMFSVSAQEAWTEWLKFFLNICTQTCHSTIRVIDSVIGLQEEFRELAMSEFRSTNILRLIDQLFITPTVSAPAVQEFLGVTHRAARMTISKLEDIGVLEKVPHFSMPEYFVARRILRTSD